MREACFTTPFKQTLRAENFGKNALFLHFTFSTSNGFYGKFDCIKRSSIWVVPKLAVFTLALKNCSMNTEILGLWQQRLQKVITSILLLRFSRFHFYDMSGELASFPEL